MIHLKVTTSNDKNAPGLYEFDFDTISLGRNNKNDLILKDNEILAFSVVIFMENNFLFIETLERDFFCYVNEKKFSGKKRLQLGDTVKIGSSSIEIIIFRKTCPELDFGELYQKFLTKSPQHKYIIDALDLEIEELEKSKGR